MDDRISRSELIAQLEGLKFALGDIILGFVVDRVIGIVKAQPAAELAPAEDRVCGNCKHQDTEPWRPPCRDCYDDGNGPSNWGCIIG
jgi:hypothetical protein